MTARQIVDVACDRCGQPIPLPIDFVNDDTAAAHMLVVHVRPNFAAADDAQRLHDQLHHPDEVTP